MDKEINPQKEKIAQQGAPFKEEIRVKSFGYIAEALGLVAGLAWNEAIKALIDALFPLGQNGLLAKFVYAAGITIIAVVATSYFLAPRSDQN